ncbi:phosphatidylglycerophosphate synthase [Thermocatellispora tengchongensis]|uniref:Phosphatidylglycerophosphate synthase n=1 Tax=Thermocatellispora tengchongensis TaxID=1073253 RepID=A0A840PJP3_9ACTN|nr:CDP-alcohol phosphatidyltransferase family protein [Thermocatellispora tengchongensis]MBB5139332.1 phosphatidylglycerophosphate synthase [Thermocatellispora tengchongensis]
MTTYSLADVRAVCKPRDAWWTVLLVDPIACRLVRVLASRTSITPNALTATAFLFGMCAAVCFALGEWHTLALGALFFHLGFIADCMDGKLARLKGNGTTFGLWLDFSLDQVRMVVCAFALAYGLFQHGGRPEAAFLAGVIIAFDLVRYLNGPQMAKVRRNMREKLVSAMSSAEGGQRQAALERLAARTAGHDDHDDHDDMDGALGHAVPGPATGLTTGLGTGLGTGLATGNASGDAPERPRRGLRSRANQGLHHGFQSRFPWYTRLRGMLLAHRIRTHLVSGIEYQMAVFVVGPLLGPAAVPYVIGVAGALLLIFESALVYKLWMSTRDFGRVMRRIQRQDEKNRVGTPLAR